MNGLVRAARWIMWMMLIVGSAACTASPMPALPTATRPTTVMPTATYVTTTPSTPTATRIPTVMLPSTATPRRPIITPIPPAAPLPTPRQRQFDDVDARAFLSALFPDLKLTPSDDAFVVNGNPNWQMWVNARAEGQFTQGDAAELAAVIANESPQLSLDQAQRYAPWGSFLAIFQKRAGRVEVAQRSLLFPALSPLVFDVRIDRVTDFDRDEQDELLIVTNSTRLGIATTAAFLYQWNDQVFAEIWSAEIGEDNTGALNQPQYFVSASTIRFADLDGDGMDEIVVESARVDYAKDAQGLANTERETVRRSERRVYRWNGTAFSLIVR